LLAAKKNRLHLTPFLKMKIPLSLPTCFLALFLYQTSPAQSFWKPTGTISDTSAFHSGILYSERTHTLFISTYNMGIFKSTNAGNNWTKVLSLPKDQPILSLFETKQGDLFAGGKGKIFRSDSSGEQWDEFSVDLPEVKSIAEDKSGNLYACSQFGPGILKSSDHGQTWNSFSNGLPTAEVNRVVNDREGNLYCTLLDDGAEIHGGLYIWDSPGNKWVKKEIKLLIDNSIYTVRVIEIESMILTEDDSFILSFYGLVSNFGVSGLIKNSLEGVYAQTAWSRFYWIDSIDNSVDFQFDQLFSTKAGHLFAGRSSGIYEKMSYSTKWFHLPPSRELANRSGYLACLPDGSVLITPDFSNRLFLTQESVPGKKVQQISFDSLETMKLYDYAELNASSSSLNPVNFSSENTSTAVVEGNRVRAVGLGYAAVKAYVDGNDSFYYNQEIQPFEVIKAGNIITVESPPYLTEDDGSYEIASQATSGEAVNLSLISGNAELQGSLLTFNSAGKIVVRASEAGNGSYEAARDLDVEICIHPRKPIIATMDSGDTLNLVSSSDTGNLWYLNSVLIAQTGKTIIPTSPGSYTLKVDAGGCLSESSDPYFFQTNGFDNPSKVVRFIVYPQPFADQLVLENKNAITGTRIRLRLMDCQARVLFTGDYPGDQENILLRTENFPVGMYLLELRANGELIHFKLFKTL
jgi:hypothetical protein